MWDIEDNSECSICQQAFESPCPKCKFPGDDCVPILGECKHTFHLHCIIKWIEENENCPLCRAKWVEKSNIHN